MRIFPTLFIVAMLTSCNNDNQAGNNTSSSTSGETKTSSKKSSHFEGAFTNGMKETFISFDISEDGSKLQNLTFKGYWRCDGKLEQTILGPEKSFEIKDNQVDGHISEPEDGGATATRYELKATINGDKAEGNFRMNINALACDTYVLNWKAEKK